MASQDVVVTYRAEVDDLTQKLRVVIDRLDKLETESKQAAKGLDTTTKSADKLEKELDSVGKSTKKATDNVKTFAKSAKTDLGGLGSQVTSIGLGIATGLGAAFSVDAIISFGKASVNAFLEAQENAEKLRFTITQVGGESEAAFQRLIDQSEKLQKITIFSDDSLQQAQNALAQFGLTSDQIEELLPKLADYASATKTDIVQATQQVGAALQGAGKEFKKYGIEVSATQTPLENLSEVTRGFAIFQGQAAQETETLAGQLKQQANEVDNLQEELGSKLAPAWVAVKKATFEATLAIVDYIKAGGGLAQTLFAREVKELGTAMDEVSENVKKLTEENIKAGQSAEEASTNALNAIRKETLARLDQAKLEKKSAEENDASEFLIKRSKLRINAILNEIAAINSLTDAKKRTGEEDAKRLTREELRLLTLEELNQKLKENEKLFGITADSNVDLINKELEARKKLSAELEKNKDVRIAGSAEEVKALKAISAEYADLFALLSDQDKAQLIELSVTAEVDTVADLNDKINRLKELIKNADLALPVLTDPDGNLLELPRQVEVLKTTLESNGISIPVDIETTSLDNLRQKVAELSVALQKELTIPVTLEAPEPMKMETGIEEAVDSDLKLWLDRNEQILTSSIDLFNSLTALYSAYAANQLAQINETTQAEIEQLDTLGKYNQEQLDKRRISEREFANRQKKLEEEKIKIQEAADKKSRDIKRKAAILDKAAALSQIIIDTAKNIASTTLPPLMALYAAVGAAQAAIVIAQPIPYKKGTKRAKGGLSQVDEEGTEAILRVREGRLTMLDQGDKVLPAHKTVTYGKVLDTMFDGTFDKHYMKKEIAPRLVKQRQLHEKAEKKSFARNISESLVINSQLNTDPIARQLGKGVNIANLDELYSIIDQNRVSPYRR